MKKALVTGSSGLVGSETVRFLCAKGFKVFGIDNDTRGYLFGKDASTSGVKVHLNNEFKNFFNINIDLRIYQVVKDTFSEYGPFDFIVHAAAQPSHEWSITHTLEDFELNAMATVNVLECYKNFSPKAILIYISSSKVYGDLVNTLPLEELETRFDLPQNHPFYEGVDENFGRLDGKLHSLFGASKACSDIMAGEYGRYFNLPIAIFRPVCVSGATHQGASAHGYLSYLVKCIALGEPYTINGYNGKQVRDNLHAFDLVTAFWEVFQDPSGSYGEAYNIGGGRLSNNSILEAIKEAENILGKRAKVGYSSIHRKGDHKWCIYSSSKFKKRYPNWKIAYDNKQLMKNICKVYENA